MKRVCVVGGAGFIGRHLVEELFAKGWMVTVIGRQRKAEFKVPVRYIQNDDSDVFFHEAFRDIDYVIELAYSTTPKTSFDNPTKDIFDNLPFSVKLFEALLKTEVKKIVYLSSGGTVYGQSVYLPIDEDHHTEPISPYGITKLAIEKYGKMYFHINNLPVVIVRPGNAYGEGQLPFRGQGFIPTAIAAALRGDAIKVYGKQGTIRDYVYVKDVVSGILAALIDGKPGECYNIGTNEGRSNLDVIGMIADMIKPHGYKVSFEVLDARPFDVISNILDYSKLESVSGWKPKTDFDSGLKKTVSWLLSQYDLSFKNQKSL